MRKAVGAAVLLLTACSQGNGAPPPNPDSLVECALSGASAFVRTCAVESRADGDGVILTVLHPDGGFRRFAVREGGKAISAADGAQLASSTAHGAGIEVAIGLDRYRLPAKILSHDAQ